MVRGSYTAVLALACTFALACGGENGGSSDIDADVPGGASWQLVRGGETASLLAVWGASADDVWVVGGRTELAGGPTILRLESGAWSRLDSGETSLDLWWVFGFAGGDVFLSGSGGTILRYRDGAFERMTTPRASGTIFGVWGAAPDDVWAVGDGAGGGGIVWRYDGATWTELALPDGVPSRVFKVSGTAADDVWISCADGVTLRWDGEALAIVPTGTTSPLFSVTAASDVVVAVGGVTENGEILEHDGAAWAAEPALSPIPWRGVAAGAGRVVAVGENGVVAERGAAGWALLAQPVTPYSFHAAWIDPDGGLWGVGGRFDRSPLTDQGFLAYHGVDTIPEVNP